MTIEDAEKAIETGENVMLTLTYDNLFTFQVVFVAANCCVMLLSGKAAKLIEGSTSHEWSVA